ncbi:hypothetical protein B2K_38915 [Paenibacillus mucilaginosus K02]|uniref:Uncharacterized protein n=1 Tax=Paenibacillus mucilaginosus K02 TaxID=997761 RepID=R9ULC7_9BACL|nr:hypothetical protein B2K_38915 [Paenibacillus mucilaginosus K02]
MLVAPAPDRHSALPPAKLHIPHRRAEASLNAEDTMSPAPPVQSKFYRINSFSFLAKLLVFDS